MSRRSTGPPHRPLITEHDRLRHVLAVGATGAGKSTLLRRLAQDDMEGGRGLLLIDPHADLAASVRDRLPRRRKNDLLFLDGTDPANCPGLNPLRKVPSERRALAASNLLATLQNIFEDGWGPRTQHLLRHVFLALMEIRGSTLVDAVALLADEGRRTSILRQIRDPHVLNFFAKELTSYSKSFLAEILAAPLNKLAAIVAPVITRAIVTKSRPALDARRVLDRQGILLASLPKGLIGDEGTLLLGGLLLGAFAQAAMSRADTAADGRAPFSIIVDEVASFATGPFVSFVTESRKYRVGLALATQSVAALDPGLRAHLLGNVGTLACFRVGADDAETMSAALVGAFSPHALQSLDTGEFVLKVGVEAPYLVRPDGARLRPWVPTDGS
ncbi:MAG: type IV secretory system conjugative DNA transfer family protein [Polyangiales bacterium]